MTGAENDYNALRERLAEAADRLSDVFGGLRAASWAADLGGIAERIRSEMFRVMIVGQFRVGKSTTINSLLGGPYLPSFAYPTTAVPTEVAYGAVPEAVLTPFDGEPVTVSPQELNDHIVITEEDTGENPYEYARLLLPAEICADGVELVDSPGLDDDPRREKRTLEYLGRADALVFVLDATHFLSVPEQQVLATRLLPKAGSELFYVINKINLVDEAERTAVERRALQRLGRAAPGYRPDRIFFVDAKGALAARRSGQEAPESTGVPDLERSLETFLRNNRARVKLLGPMPELIGATLHAAELIDGRRDYLSLKADDLAARLEAVQPKLHQAQDMRLSIINRLDSEIGRLEQTIRGKAEQFLLDLTPKIPGWIEEAELTAKIGMLPWKVKGQRSEVRQEITQIVAGHTEAEFARWAQEELRPLVTARMESIARQTEQGLDDLLAAMKTIRLSLRVDQRADEGAGIGQRIVAGVGGIILGPGAGLAGAQFGVKPMAVMAGVELALAVGAAALGLAVGPIAALLWVVALPANAILVWRQNEALRKQVGKELADQIEKTRADRAHAISNEMTAQLQDYRAAIVTGTERRIEEVELEVGKALEAKRLGKEEQSEERARLDSLARTLKDIEAELTRIHRDAVGG